MEDTFESDAPEQDNIPTSLTHFKTSDGKLISSPSEFDTKTGENLTIKKGSQLGLTPIKMMMSQKGTVVPVTYDELGEAFKLGLKPQEQVEAEQNAAQSLQNVKEGNIGLNNVPISSSVVAGLGRGMSSNLEPQAVGAYEGLKNLTQGGDFTPAYKQGVLAEESANTALQKAHPNAYLGGEIAGGTTQFMGGAEAELPQLASKIPFGSFGRNVVGSAGLGVLGGGTEAANQGSDISQGAVQGGKYGTLGAILGQTGGALLGKGIGAARTLGNVGSHLIPTEATDYLKAGMQGENYLSPEFREQNLNAVAEAPKNIFNTLMESKQGIGAQKGGELNNLSEAQNIFTKKNEIGSQISKQSYANDVSNTILRNLDAYKEAPPEARYQVMDEINKSLGLKTKPFDPADPPTVDDMQNFAENLKDLSSSSIEKLTPVQNQMESQLQTLTGKTGQRQLLDDSPLVDSLNSAKNQLLRRQKKDFDPDAQVALRQGLTRIEGNLRSLQENPNDPEVIDSIKRNLAADLYDNSGNKIIEDYNVRKTMLPSQKLAQNMLEEMSPPTSSLTPGYKENKLGNINLGYKSILEAENPKEVFDTHYLSPSDVEDLANGQGMNASTRMKFNNLRNLNEEIQNNPDVHADIKNNMSDLLNNLSEVSRKGGLSKDIVNAKGVSGSVNKTANYIGNEYKDILNKLSPSVQKLIELSPDFKNKILPALGLGMGAQYDQTGPTQ